MSKDLYSQPSQYDSALPIYQFGDLLDTDIFRLKVKAALHSENGSTIADIGGGNGRCWNCFGSHISTILCVEPNRRMWSTPIADSRVRYIEQDGLDFAANYQQKIDLVTWFWSLNYAILTHFEHFDPVTKKITGKDWQEGAKIAKSRLVEAFRNPNHQRYLIAFFDAESEEQKFLTSIWEEVHPFPFHDRSYTRKLLDEVLLDSLSSSLTVRLERFEGLADYGEGDEAFHRFNAFGLRNTFLNDKKIQSCVREFLSNNSSPEGRALVPSGMWIYDITRAPS